MIDGYWLPHGSDGDKVLILYYDPIHEKAIWFSILDGEKKVYIREDLKFLRDHMGYRDIISCTCDGGVGILSALKEVYPDCIIQRCLVHIQRQIQTYLTQNPKSLAGKEFLHLSTYPILSDPLVFPEKWMLWKKTHQKYINEKTVKPEGGSKYIHINLRRAINLVDNALPYMFQFHKYNNPKIEKTSNKIE